MICNGTQADTLRQTKYELRQLLITPGTMNESEFLQVMELRGSNIHRASSLKTLKES